MSDAYPQPRRRRSRWWIPAIAVVVVIAVAAAMVWLSSRGHKDGETSAPQASQQTSTPASQPGMATTGGGGNVNSDFWGRRVVVPSNPDGDVLEQHPVDPANACDKSSYARVPGDLQAQRTHTMSTLWSSTDGPTGITESIPSGYSHTPQGAALAGWNYFSLFNVGGEIGYSSARNFFGFSEEEKRELESIPGGPDKEITRDRTKMVAPAAVKYLSCHDDQVVVQYFLPVPDMNTGEADRPRYALLQLPVKWVGGHWELNMDKNTNTGGNMVDSIDGEAVQWDY
ncbi:hypothetical protein [Corynebacterium bovis]|uniref:hypothetical protein n=1 Tax=Corynebacterium bovis TaxID=36808 RepID=UPI000219301B|nr:hypothetical protein [Corynebacterium bovis]QQC48644.1 hypothetical protein I6I09_11015 [Corynebacterium bovis]WJY78605.1 hypothetical protein CBOVI_10615 [Corynebacterium bovis DSM 20582 = CIP 54.80]